MELFDIVINTSIDFISSELFIQLFLPIFVFCFCIYILRSWGNKF